MIREKQINRVVAYLKEYKTITRKEAMNQLGIANLTAIISCMRDEGYPITKIMCNGYNRFGEPVRYATYYFKEKENGES